MNNIQEKDWAEDDWSGHTGMDSDSCYCTRSIANDSQDAEKDVSSEKPAHQPFTIHYEFIRRGEVEIVFSFKKSTIPVRALFFTDPLLDLIESALQLHQGALKYSVLFIDNTGEHQLVLKREQERELVFEIRRFKKGENLEQAALNCNTVAFKGRTTVEAYCLQVLEVVNAIDQNIGADQYKTKWINAEFPQEAYCRLKMEQDSLK